MALGIRVVSLSVLAVMTGCAGSTSEPQQLARADVSATPAVPDSATSCFAPLPGHPTPAEQRAFVDEVSRLAVEAERHHGVPAAAIAAMAIQESGYGWTTLAQQTNDILAWKYTTASAAGGRELVGFRLRCQQGPLHRLSRPSAGRRLRGPAARDV